MNCTGLTFPPCTKLVAIFQIMAENSFFSSSVRGLILTTAEVSFSVVSSVSGGGKFLDTHIVISLLVFVLSKYHRDKIDILMAKVHKINETSKRKAKYFLSLA